MALEAESLSVPVKKKKYWHLTLWSFSCNGNMAVASNAGSALPEHWTELIASRKERRACAQDVDTIKKSCEAEHGTKHVVECQGCFEKVLDRMLARFNQESSREWFAGRRAAVLGLENLFAEAKERKADLKDIEASIGSEKEAWYRWVLRRYPEFLAVAESDVDQEEVRGALDDPDKSREELVAIVSQAAGMPGDWSFKVDAFADKVEAANGDPQALQKLYVEEFFINQSTGEALEDAQKFLDEYRSSQEAGLEHIIDKILSVNKDSRTSQAQRNMHQKRLDELRRAKTAFEKNKQLAKSQQQGAQASNVDDRYYNLPPCSVCQKEVDSSDVSSCEICQMMAQMGGDKPMTLYCSDACHDKGFVSDYYCHQANKPSSVFFILILILRFGSRIMWSRITTVKRVTSVCRRARSKRRMWSWRMRQLVPWHVMNA